MPEVVHVGGQPTAPVTVLVGGQPATPSPVIVQPGAPSMPTEVVVRPVGGEQGEPGEQGVQGPPGPAIEGPPGPAGPPGGVTELRFTQSDAAQVWTISHGFPHRPVVRTFNNDDDEIVGDVTHPDTSTVRVEWFFPMSGYTVLI